MLRYSIAVGTALLVLAGSLLAADKEVKGKVVKVDVKKNIIIVMTEDGKDKEYDVNKDTKFIGPKGGVSEKGIEDDRLKPGAEVTLKVAGNNKTLHEVHLPERKGKDER